MKKIKTLKKNYEFKNVLSNGKFYKGKQIIIYVLPNKNKTCENRVGIAVSTKICKAVHRNRLKRLIRENYRLIKNNLNKSYNIVFLWNKKVDYKEADFHVIEADMQYIFKKIGILL